MSFPLDDVLRALHRSPRIMILANPNNPTGTTVAPTVLRKLIPAFPRTLFVVDEAYHEFSRITVLPWIRRYPNLAVVRTFSKAAGLAGLRFGCIAASAEVTRLLSRTLDTFPVNVAAMAAVQAALRDQKSIWRYAAQIARSRKVVSQVLAGMGIRMFPSTANFVLADFGPQAPHVVRALARQGIFLRDRAADFGRPGFVRITLGTMPQMKRLIRALKALL